jgi:hypothetical protein
MTAASYGDADVARVLVEAGADLDALAAPTTDVLALIMAADHQRLAVIDELLAAGTPVDAVDGTWHRQALRVAAEHGRAASVRHLLARGADPNARDAEGRSALDLTGDDAVEAMLRPLTAPAPD